ncbi:MAG: hypothetical protein M5R36_07405, partial [Deltaproteobacteria bacterium]|nr:hypothetical protein [Deltaproteobacteria bacterium]
RHLDEARRRRRRVVRWENGLRTDGAEFIQLSFFSMGHPATSTLDNGQWRTSIIDTDTTFDDRPGVTDLGLDFASQVRVSYFDGQSIVMAVRNGPDWDTEAVAGAGAEFGDHSTVFKFDQTLHVLFYDAAEKKLKHAAEATDEGMERQDGGCRGRRRALRVRVRRR